MNVAYLFDSNSDEFDGIYGIPILEKLIESTTLQCARRDMRLSVGDILSMSYCRAAGGKTYEDLEIFDRNIYRTNGLNLLLQERLNATFGTHTVYCVLFQNIRRFDAESLHRDLVSFEPYLGCMEVDFSNNQQLQLFRNSLIEKYRIRGRSLFHFYEMGGDFERDYADVWIAEICESNGFTYSGEDMGARRTIFDKYEGVSHFKRVELFRQSFAEMGISDSETIDDIVHTIEEIHPQLFDVLASAAKALHNAETEEDYAQAALSGRRFLEKLADSLFPPREEVFEGRKVGKTQYKNRLWAYLVETTRINGSDPSKLNALGKEVDFLVERFCGGVHLDSDPEKVRNSFRRLVVLLRDLIELDRSALARPFTAYIDEMDSLFDGR